MSSTVRVRIEDEATGTLLVEYVGIPASTVGNVVATLDPWLERFKRAARAKRLLEELVDTVSGAGGARAGRRR